MNLIAIHCGWPPFSIKARARQLFLVMKLTALLITLSILSVSAKTLAQRVTLHQKNVPIDQVLNEIRKQTSFDIVYDENKIQAEGTVTIDVNNTQLSDVLTKLFKGRDFDYTIANKALIIKAKETSFLVKVKAFAAIDVHGRVVDATGKALPGVTVKVKESSQATITGTNGEFDLKKVDENATLVFSFVGYISKEIAANGDFSNIRMEVSNSKLDEVQIQAYGQTSKRLTVGNISSVKLADLANQPVTNVLSAIEGRLPGLLVNQSTGLPGAGFKINAQGLNSITRGNEPFYVIDGVPYNTETLPNFGNILGTSGSNNPLSGFNLTNGNPLSLINIGDIESIELLKDADATAIYGSRAANGALLITTKKGKIGKTSYSVNINSGISQVPHKMKLLNTLQYLDVRNEAFKNDGVTPGDFDYDLNGTWDKNRYTDWQKKLLGNNAHFTNAQFDISGGSPLVTYLVGGNFHRETTVFLGDFDDKKASIHWNLNSNSEDNKFKFLLSGSYLNDNNNLPNNDPTSPAITLAPNAPMLFLPNGDLNWQLDKNGRSTWVNPLANTLNNYHSTSNNLILNSTVSYQFTRGLKLSSSFGYNRTDVNEQTTSPLVAVAPENRPTTNRSASYGFNQISSWIIEPQLNYEQFVSKGRLSILIGSTFQKSDANRTVLSGSNYSSDFVLGNINAATKVTAGGTVINSYRYNAVFGRANYNWEDKYLLNFAIRRDGSSRFGANNQFHNFWSVGGGWIAIGETNSKNALSFLKFRTSYGTTGSDQIGDYQFLNLYDPLSVGVPYQAANSLIVKGLPNPYLQWEETKKLNLGADIGLFKDRVFVTANYYINHSSNNLVAYNLPAITGFTSIEKNFPAVIKNTGLELSIVSSNISSDNFSWKTNLNLTIPRNKLVSFPNLETSSFKDALVIGQPIAITKTFQYEGVNQTTGLYQFLAADGRLTSDPDPSKDKTVIVDTQPKFFGGIQNSFSYKNFDLDFFIQYVKQKGKNNFFGTLPGSPYNQPIEVLNRWQKPGDNGTHQQFDEDYSTLFQYFNVLDADRVFSDASYFRLKNISLSWRIPTAWNQAMHVKSVKLYFQGQNLLTITNYVGLDPETRSLTTLPTLRTLVFGIQANL